MSLLVIDWEAFIDPSPPGESPAWLDGPLALSVGVFDGVHRGHQRLIAKILDYAGKQGGTGGVVTFRQNPRRILHPGDFPGDLYSLPQKLKTLEELGAAFAVLIDFSGDFSRISGKEFAALLGRRRVSYLAVGANFRCGYRLDTGAQCMREMMEPGGTVTELAPQLRENGAPISSSRVRAAVLAGDVAGAADLLGRPYCVDLTGLRPIIDGGVFSWDLGKAGRVLPPAGLYNGLFRTGTAVFPAEFSLDSGRFSLKRDAAAEGPEDLLNFSTASIEFRPGLRG
jgi:hypothetical protein